MRDQVDVVGRPNHLDLRTEATADPVDLDQHRPPVARVDGDLRLARPSRHSRESPDVPVPPNVACPCPTTLVSRAGLATSSPLLQPSR